VKFTDGLWLHQVGVTAFYAGQVGYMLAQLDLGVRTLMD